MIRYSELARVFQWFGNIRLSDKDQKKPEKPEKPDNLEGPE